MQIKTVPLIETKADPETGTFTALASVFGNVDIVGDRMLKGAFKETLTKWRASGDPIPVILSHKWDDPWATIGEADPRSVLETDRGLLVQGNLHMDNPLAKQVHKLMARGLLKGWSFGYTVPKGGQKRENGANEISQVDLVEVGPTLKGANPEAQLQAVKSGELQPDEIEWNVETKRTDEESATMAALVARMRELGDSPSPEAMLAFASRIQNELSKDAPPDTKELPQVTDEPQTPAVPDDTDIASTTARVEGGKAEEPRPRDPLRDKFDRILLGLE